MTKICANADIQSEPCAGSVFSRSIICLAGMPNKCLRNCHERCPSHSVIDQPKPPAPRVVQQSKSPPKSLENYTMQRKPCGTCGK